MNDTSLPSRSRDDIFDGLSETHRLLGLALEGADPTLDETYLRRFAVWCGKSVTVHGDFQLGFQESLHRTVTHADYRKRQRERGANTARAACSFALGRLFSSAAAFACVFACASDDPVDAARAAGGWAAMYALITTEEAAQEIQRRILGRLVDEAPWMMR